MKKFISRYKLFIMLVAVNIFIVVFFPPIGEKSLKLTLNNMVDMLLVLPPIFILLGLLDVWVERETLMKLMGEKSGILGVLIAFLMGSAAAGPLYAAFPIAGVLLRKGCKFFNMLIFIGAWSSTKIPMLLFETASMGWKFTLTRLLVDIAGIALIARIMEKALSPEDKKGIVDKALAFK